MTPAEANTVLALLRHLDGSQIVEADDLMIDVKVLFEDADWSLFDGAGAHGLDEDTLFDTLAEVGQRHADAGR